MTMRLGVHCSVRHGFVKALEQAKGLDCDTLQIFTHSPRLWRAPRIDQEAADRFHQRRQELGLFPLIVHTPFLPNLSTTDEKMAARSERALGSDLEICERLRADYLIIHPGAYSTGSHVGEAIQRLADALNRALDRPGRTILLLENMAGGGRRIGDRFEQLRDILGKIHHRDRLAFCLDTAHTLASGYPFSSADEVETTLRLFDQTLGLATLRVVHANDSKDPRSSHRDRHEHIGKGYIGEEAFSALLQDPRLAEVAVILETPKDSVTADQRNIQRLRSLVNQ